LGRAALAPIQSADLPGKLFDAVQQSLFHVPDREHDRIYIVPRWSLRFVARLGHEIVG
jgi:hypothetical protein